MRPGLPIDARVIVYFGRVQLGVQIARLGIDPDHLGGIGVHVFVPDLLLGAGLGIKALGVVPAGHLPDRRLGHRAHIVERFEHLRACDGRKLALDVEAAGKMIVADDLYISGLLRLVVGRGHRLLSRVGRPAGRHACHCKNHQCAA